VPMLLAGAGIGIGLLILARSLTPARPELAATLDRLNRPAAILGAAPAETHRVLVSLAGALGMDRLIGGSVAIDLRLLGRSRDAHLARCLSVGIESALVVPAVLTVLALGGVQVPVAVPVALLVGLGLTGALLPNLVLPT
jgi:hypothetical protein